MTIRKKLGILINRLNFTSSNLKLEIGTIIHRRDLNLMIDKTQGNCTTGNKRAHISIDITIPQEITKQYCIRLLVLLQLDLQVFGMLQIPLEHFLFFFFNKKSESEDQYKIIDIANDLSAANVLGKTEPVDILHQKEQLPLTRD